MSARVVLAAIGPWEALPELSAQFRLSLEPVDAEWREDLIQRGWETEALSKPQLKLIRGHGAVIWAEREVTARDLIRDAEGEGARYALELDVAREAAWLLKALAELGASALYFDPAEKVIHPEALKDFPVQDSVALLHLFVELWGEEGAVLSEGMSIFGLPDLRVEGVATQAAAQATAFGAAAHLVCEGLALPEGASFQASESFPSYRSFGVRPAEGEGAEEAHPFGLITLRADFT